MAIETNNNDLQVNSLTSIGVVYASNGNSNTWNTAYTVATTYQSASSNFIVNGGNLKNANITIGTNDNFDLNFETANSTRMVITSTGAIKINEDNGDRDLQIGSQTVDFLIGTDASTSRVCINHSTNAPAGTLDIRSTNNVPCLVVNANTLVSDFKIGSSAVDHMLYGAANNSRIGINTNTPAGALHVVRYGASAANGPVLIVNADNKDADFQFGSQTTDFLLFGDASANTIGINTSAANERLTVVGNISATGVIYGQSIGPIGLSSVQQTYVNITQNEISELLIVNNPVSSVIIIPPDSTTNFVNGSQVNISRIGAGTVTVSASPGVFLRSADNKKELRVQNSTATVVKLSANDWLLFGDIV